MPLTPLIRTLNQESEVNFIYYYLPAHSTFLSLEEVLMTARDCGIFSRGGIQVAMIMTIFVIMNNLSNEPVHKKSIQCFLIRYHEELCYHNTYIQYQSEFVLIVAEEGWFGKPSLVFLNHKSTLYSGP